MWPGRVPSGSGRADHGALSDPLSAADHEPREMSIKSVNPVTVVDDDRVAVPISPAGKDDRARCSDPARRRGLRANVDAAVKARKPAARPKLRGDRTTHRPPRP